MSFEASSDHYKNNHQPSPADLQVPRLRGICPMTVGESISMASPVCATSILLELTWEVPWPAKGLTELIAKDLSFRLPAYQGNQTNSKKLDASRACELKQQLPVAPKRLHFLAQLEKKSCVFFPAASEKMWVLLSLFSAPSCALALLAQFSLPQSWQAPEVCFKCLLENHRSAPPLK